MSTATYPENRRAVSLEARQAERQARRSQARQTHEAALADHDTARAYSFLIGSAGLLIAAKRYRDARTVLMTVLEMTMRLHFLLLAGRPDGGDLGVGTYAHKLRSIGAIDKRTLDEVRALLNLKGTPINEPYIRRLLALVRRFRAWTFPIT